MKVKDFVKFLKPGWWMAADQDGKWYAYEVKPKKLDTRWGFAPAIPFYCFDIDSPGNWETSLIQNKLLPHNFKIGDRVRVYGEGVFDGIIESISDSNADYLFVVEDGFYSVHDEAPYHYKQCRRLMKKKKKEEKRKI